MDSLVSVVIPVYNAEDYISETIKSVQEQNYNHWELIIVNDGSIDNTREIIDGMKEKDDRIKIFNKSNTGVSDSRNKGADIATGDYLCFLDSDDIFLRDNLKKKATFLDQNPKIGLVHANIELINKYGDSLGESLKGKTGNILDSLLLWEDVNIPAPSSIMVRKTVFENAGKWDVQFSTAADQDFFIRVAAMTPIGAIDETLTQYRVLEQSMSRNISIMEKDHIGVYQKARRLGLFRSFWFKQRCFSNLYLILAGSWWKNGSDKLRGLYFILKALLYYPLNMKKLIVKFF